MPNGKTIVKKLALVAAKEIEKIQEERLFPNCYAEYENAVSAYGISRIEEDFRDWLQDLKSKKIIPSYPLGDYLKSIDSRLKSPENGGTGAVNGIPFIKKANLEDDKKTQNMITTSREKGRADFEARRAAMDAEKEQTKELPLDQF
jgi:hypothetical protein